MMSLAETAPPRRTFKQHAFRVAPFMLLGPITGPLVAGVVLNLKDRRPVLAGMYAVLLVELTLAAPLLAAALTKMAVSAI
ncbi:MAG: hypothetical protein PHG43_02385 [Phenylobacterium sp.]|nr:hypothetical protein [Phenylobacterium sp.]